MTGLPTRWWAVARRTYASRVLVFAVAYSAFATALAPGELPNVWLCVSYFTMCLMAASRTPVQYRAVLVGIGIAASATVLRVFMGAHEASDIAAALSTSMTLAVTYWCYWSLATRAWPRHAWLRCRDGSRIDLDLRCGDGDGTFRGLRWMAYAPFGPVLAPAGCVIESDHPNRSIPPRIELRSILSEDGKRWVQPRVPQEGWSRN